MPHAQPPAPITKNPWPGLNGRFWGQKGAFTAQKRPIYELIIRDNNDLLRSDLDWRF